MVQQFVYRPNQELSNNEFKRWVSTHWPDMRINYPFGWGPAGGFGDGKDGDLVVGSNFNIDSHVIKYYNNLSVSAGYTLGSNGSYEACMWLCVKGTLLVNGTISMDGKGGYVANTDSASGTDYASSYAGSGGGGGYYGISPPTLAGDGGSTIVAGGLGGNSDLTRVAAAGSAIGVFNTNYISTNNYQKGVSVLQSYGGAGGNGAYTYFGRGGFGGGVIIIMAGEVIVSATGVITADGAAGANATTSGGDGGGGGGGGGGGMIYIITRRYTNSGSVAASGGAAGNGAGAGGTAGAAGGAGTVIQETVT